MTPTHPDTYVNSDDLPEIAIGTRAAAICSAPLVQAAEV